MTASRPISVAVDLPLRTGDAAFTFAAGPAAGAPPGTPVVIPIGARLVAGVILGDAPARANLRPVVGVIDGAPVLPRDVLELIRWTADTYVASVGEALALAIPWAALCARIRVGAHASEDAVDPPYRAIVEALRRRALTLTRAARVLAAAPDGARALAERAALSIGLAGPAAGRGDESSGGPWPAGVGADTVGADTVGSVPAADALLSTIRPPRSAARWVAALRSALEAGQRSVVLAGWDRAAAYREAIRGALVRGWSCIVACPTVDAAATLAAMLRGAGLNPTLLHGEQPPSTRLATWRDLVGRGRAVVVGTRAVIYAPVAGPVLAIVDDDDHSGHKEERAPRYVTSVVAAHRTRTAGSLIAGSATPSVEAFVRVQSGAAALVAVPSPRPQIGIIDIRGRRDPAVSVSAPVIDLVRREVRKRGRVLVLADRKGYAGGLHCAECGAVHRCARCGVAMAYERADRRLRCRSCGAVTPATASCARCGGRRLYAIGAGTERVAAAARKITSATWRLDSDTIARRADLEDSLRGFAARGGIVVATVIVMPYLAALRPSLVVVVGADRWLHRPEYRATERALALFRALGMGSGARVLVETSDPTHPVLRAIGGSLRAWYDAEAALREALGYPPFRALAAVTIAAPSQDAVARAVDAVRQRAAPPVEVLEHGAVHAAGRREHAQRVVIKAPDRDTIRALLWPDVAGGARPRGVRMTVDVDPLDLA
jgi:primosomal protein N' (replication factor Y)